MLMEWGESQPPPQDLMEPVTYFAVRERRNLLGSYMPELLQQLLQM